MTMTPRLKIDEIAVGQSQKEITHNEGLRAIDALVQLSIIDKDLTTPPAHNHGDTYIVGPSATGDWATHDDEIAQSYNAEWFFYAPEEGWITWVKDENLTYLYTGAAWEARDIPKNVSMSAAPGATNDNTEGYSINSTWIETGVTPNEIWRAIDVTTGAAVWLQTTLTIDELGTIATQDSNAVSITGGSISGITDLAIADGGTSASTISGAQQALDLEPGVDIQAFDQELLELAAITTVKGKVIVYTDTVLSAIVVGANDEVLIADSAESLGVRWGAQSGGGGGDLGDLDDVTITAPADNQIIQFESGGAIWENRNDLTIPGDVVVNGGDVTINETSVDGNAILHLINDVQEWRVITSGGTADGFVIRDFTASANPFIIEAGANNGAFLLDSSGELNLTGDLRMVAGAEILGTTETNTMSIGGGATLSTGGNIQLQGQTAGGDVTLRTDATNMLHLDGATSAATFSNIVDVQGSTLTVGLADSVAGRATFYGDGAASNEGGQINLNLAADFDSVFNGYSIDAWQDDMRIFGNSFITVYKDDGDWEFPVDVRIAGGGQISGSLLVGTTGTPDTTFEVLNSGGGASDFTHFREGTDTADLVLRWNGTDEWQYFTEIAGGGNHIMSLHTSGQTTFLEQMNINAATVHHIRAGTVQYLMENSTDSIQGGISVSTTAVSLGSFTDHQVSLFQDGITRLFIDTSGNITLDPLAVVNVLSDITSGLFHWDMSEDQLGIGIVTPSVGGTAHHGIHIHNAGTGGSDRAMLQLTTGDTGSGTTDGLQISYDSANQAIINNYENTTFQFRRNNIIQMQLENRVDLGEVLSLASGVDLFMGGNAIVFGQIGTTNIDQIYYNDGPGSLGGPGDFHFVADTTYKATTNYAGLHAGYLYVENTSLFSGQITIDNAFNEGIIFSGPSQPSILGGQTTSDMYIAGGNAVNVGGVIRFGGSTDDDILIRSNGTNIALFNSSVQSEFFGDVEISAGFLNVTDPTRNTVLELESGDAGFALGFGDNAGSAQFSSGGGSISFIVGADTGTFGNTGGVFCGGIDIEGQFNIGTQPAVLANVSSTVNNVTGNAAAYTIIFNTEIHDQANNFNTGNGTFTASKDGIYNVLPSARLINMTGAADSIQMRIVTSNRTYFLFDQNVNTMGSHRTVQYPSDVDMDDNDTLTIQVIVSGEASNLVDLNGGGSSITHVSIRLTA